MGMTGNRDANTGALGATTWRDVQFIGQAEANGSRQDQRWLMMSDVCKHCANAACLEACPTGSLVRTEFGSVYVQQDICNGCGFCVPACPFGVIDRAPKGSESEAGAATRCTHGYDRLNDAHTPPCARQRPTPRMPVRAIVGMTDTAPTPLRGLQHRVEHAASPP